jgi:hypothetical protein
MKSITKRQFKSKINQTNSPEVSYNVKFPFIKPSMYAVIAKAVGIMLVVVNSKRKALGQKTE